MHIRFFRPASSFLLGAAFFILCVGTPVMAMTDTPEPGVAADSSSPVWLLTHPDSLATARQALDRWRDQALSQRMIMQALNQENALLHEQASPVLHDSGAVTIVEFFDYQCVFCSRFASQLEQFVVAEPGVRVVFKEWPIFGARWPLSQVAARTGLAVWQKGGESAYWQYHNAVFSTGHNEGALTQVDIDSVLKALALGRIKPVPAKMDPLLATNATLAEKMGLHGTPAFIVMPSRGATADTTTVLPGMPDIATLTAAVQRAQEVKPEIAP